jgi:hypothetical protein
MVKKEMFSKDEKKRIRRDVLLILGIFMLLLFVQNVTGLLADNLVSYYTFNNTNISSTGNLPLSPSGTASYSYGKIGNGTRITNVLYFTTPDSPLYDTQNLTWVMWVNTTNSSRMALSSKWWDGANRNFDLFLNDRGDGTASAGFITYMIGYSGAFINASCNVGSTLYDGNFHFIGITMRYQGYISIYFDNTTVCTTNKAFSILYNGAIFGLGGESSSGTIVNPYFYGMVDEMGFWNRSLSSTEITQLYNNGAGVSYPLDSSASVPVFINQSPSNIDALNAVGVDVMIYYNYTGVNTSNAQIEYGHPGMNEYINGTLQPLYSNKSYTSVNGSVVRFDFGDNSVYGYTANYDDENMSITPHGLYTITGVSDVLKTEILNVSNNLSFNIVEIMVNSTNNINVFYCNSSYTTGAPGLNSNCVLFASGTYPGFNHTVNYSRHNVFSLPIISNKVGNVTVTSTSYIVIRPLVLQTAQLGYINGSVRNGMFQVSGNGGNTYTTDNTKIPDLHIHQYSGSSSENFTYRAHDSWGNYSVYQVDSIGVVPLPPTSPQVTSPTSSNITWTDTINITWTASVPDNNLTRIVNYTVDLFDASLIQVRSIGTYSNSTFNVSNYGNFTGLKPGTYYVKVTAIDNISNSVSSYSEPFNILSVLYSPCNQSIVLNSTGMSILFNWSSDVSIINTSLVGSKNIITNTTLTNTTGNKTINNTITNGTYTLYFSQLINDSTITDYNTGCTLQVCVSSWTRTNEQCLGNLRLINYTDVNGCSEVYDRPSDYNTYEDCTLPADTDRELWFIILLILVWIIGVILAVLYAPIIIFISWLTSAGLWFYANSYFGNILFGLIISVLTVLLTAVIIGFKK